MGSNVVSTSGKGNLAAYVHDVYDVETRLYRMKKLRDELYRGKAAFREKTEERYALKAPEEPQKIALEEEKKVPHKPRFFFDWLGWPPYTFEVVSQSSSGKGEILVGLIVSLGILGGIISSIIAGILFLFHYSDPWGAAFTIGYLIIVGLLVLDIIILPFFMLIVSTIVSIRNYIQDLQSYPIEVAEIEAYNRSLIQRNAEIKAQNADALMRYYQEVIPQYKKKLQEAREKITATCAAYDEECRTVENALKELERHREQMYTVGYIPPDYRGMTQAFVFDYVFRNDLADTIREAVFYYEQREFRLMTLAGVEKLHTALTDLRGEVRSMAEKLSEQLSAIHSDVALISDDLSDLLLTQRSIALQNETLIDQNEQIYKETRAARLASEDVAHTTKRLAHWQRTGEW